MTKTFVLEFRIYHSTHERIFWSMVTGEMNLWRQVIQYAELPGNVSASLRIEISREGFCLFFRIQEGNQPNNNILLHKLCK